MLQTSKTWPVRPRLASFAIVLAACTAPISSPRPAPIAPDPPATQSAAATTSPVDRSPAAVHADQLFWRTFHGGAYDEIPAALRALKAAYLAHPRDAVTASHIGWLHIWRLAEHARLSRPDPAITDDAVLGRAYFERAVRLDPRDARYLGFYASLLLTESSLHQDDELRHRGVDAMKHAVAAWPEFNLFTAGYGPSREPYQSARFRDALEAQWQNLDLCLGRTIDRNDPDLSRLPRPRFEGTRRVCGETDVAPHNSEGFYLNFGDMLVKAGDVDAAVTMYRNALSIPSYSSWPFRDVLEARIRDAAANVAVFRQPGPPANQPRPPANQPRPPANQPGPPANQPRPPANQPAMMVASTFACMACHQQ